MPSASQASGELDIPHQMFIAKLRNTGTMAAKDVKNLHVACLKYGRDNLQLYRDGFPTLEESIKRCVGVLRDFGYSICKLQTEESAKMLYAHVRIAKRPWDEVMMNPDDSKNHKFFVDVLKRILANPPDFRITEFDALQASDSLDLGTAKKLLAKWVDSAYFEYIEGMYFIGPLSAFQYEDEIAEFIPNQPKCDLCKKFVFRGVFCRHCPEALHKYCYRLLSSQMKKGKQRDKAVTCHACRTPYPDPNEVQTSGTQSTQGVDDTQNRVSDDSD